MLPQGVLLIVYSIISDAHSSAPLPEPDASSVTASAPRPTPKSKKIVVDPDISADELAGIFETESFLPPSGSTALRGIAAPSVGIAAMSSPQFSDGSRAPPIPSLTDVAGGGSAESGSPSSLVD
jgi:hypothetical protein